MDYIRQKFNRDMPIWVREKIPPWRICHFNLKGQIPIKEVAKKWWEIKRMFLEVEKRNKKIITADGWIQL